MAKQTLTNKQQQFIVEYLIDFNATRAAIRAGYSEKTAYSIGQENLKKPEIVAEIQARLSDRVMAADEVLVKLSEQARADIGVFFKIVEEWTFFPLPTYDILDAREVVDDSDPEKPEKRISYFTRHVTIDTDRLVDQKYSHLIHKFSDSPKNGICVELYNKQNALQLLAKRYGLLVDRTELTGANGAPIEVNQHDEQSVNRALSTLADAIGKSLSGEGAKQDGNMDTAVNPSVDGSTIQGG